MTAFPGSLKTYTRQEDVASPVTGVGFINAADINELQEEVEAIEIELGTTPSSADHATVAARFTAVEDDGNLFVAAGKTIGFEGVSGNTYQKFNTTDNTFDTYVDGTLLDALTTAQLEYIETAHSTDYAYALSANNGYFVKIHVPSRIAITKLKCAVTSAAAASKLIHLGIYDDTGDKLIESGDIAADSTGVKTDTVASTVLLRGIYWLAISTDDAPTVAGSGGASTEDLGQIRGTDYAGYAGLGGLALPSTMPSLTAMGACPYVGAYE
jgi:hypothetical protein